jgi:C1A family cysteine protease
MENKFTIKNKFFMTHKYGWIKGTPDSRDRKYSAERLLPIKTVYLNPDSGYKMPPVWDQGQLGACTAFGWSFAVMFDLLNKHASDPMESGYSPSQIFIYYWERSIEGTIGTDSGAQIRDGAKAINKYGVCNETLMPYVISDFVTPPTDTAATDALNYKALTYTSLDNTNKQLLVDALQQGFPIVFGFTVYESFESDTVNETSVVPYPDINTEQVLGGHCMSIVGFHEGEGDDDTFICRNSWGKDWGSHGGYCRMPTRYLTDPSLASDFWILKMVE